MSKVRIVICGCLIVLISALRVQAQENPLQKRISITIVKQSIEKTLQNIEKSAQIHFSYNPDIIPLDSIISIQVQNLEVHKVLIKIFGDRYLYKTSGKYIIITKKKQSKPISKSTTPIQVQGTIVNKESGKAIANTSVYSINGKEQALTDTAGHFFITFSPKQDNVNLAVTNTNFVDTLVFLADDSLHTLTIELQPKATQIHDSVSIENNQIASKFIDEEMKIHSKNIDYLQTRPFQISLVPFAGTNFKLSGSIANVFSLNLICGYSYGVKGIEIGGFSNINRKNVNGIQVAGFGNFTGGKTNGIQVAGFFNQNLQKVNGIQAAGFYNMVTDTVQGIQAAGFCNISTKSSRGIQVAGFSNISRQSYIGLQASGFANISGRITGSQVAGFSNLTGTISGNQVAGFLNVAARYSHGTQISGFLNVAMTVKGAQIGIINIADSVSGISIGVLNFIHNGLHQVSVGYSNLQDIQLQLHLGTNLFYNTLGVIAFTNFTEFKGVTYGIGSLFFSKRIISISPQLQSSYIFKSSDTKIISAQCIQSKIDINLRLHKNIHLFVAPQYSLLVFSISQPDFSHITENAYISNIKSYTNNNNTLQYWLGGMAGLKFSL